MAKQIAEEAEMTETKRMPRKISVDILKPEEGERVEGVLIGRTTGPWVDKATGETKELTRLHFRREDGTRFLIFEDAGLRNALTNAMVQDGHHIVLEKGKKQKLAGGRTVNNWEVYTYEVQ